MGNDYLTTEDNECGKGHIESPGAVMVCWTGKEKGRAVSCVVFVVLWELLEDPAPGEAPLAPAGAGLGPFLPISLLRVCCR